jgi:DNA-binding NtrC family response regulator
MGMRILFLDDDDDLRETVVGLIEEMGVTCEAVSSVAEMQAVIRRSGSAFDLAILDINLGADQPSGVDAYRWLRQEAFRGRIAFLTGHARSHPLVAEALRTGDAVVHDKPMTVDALRAMLAERR